jgi:hypothetical protein
MWKPVDRSGNSLPYELKKTLSRKLWDTDGSIGGSAVVDAELIPYLEGLQHAGVDGAEELIEAINTHEQVEVWHEY